MCVVCGGRGEGIVRGVFLVIFLFLREVVCICVAGIVEEAMFQILLISCLLQNLLLVMAFSINLPPAIGERCPSVQLTTRIVFLFLARIYLNILPATANTSYPLSRCFGSSHRQDQTFLSPARSFSHGLPKRPSEL